MIYANTKYIWHFVLGCRRLRDISLVLLKSHWATSPRCSARELPEDMSTSVSIPISIVFVTIGLKAPDSNEIDKYIFILFWKLYFSPALSEPTIDYGFQRLGKLVPRHPGCLHIVTNNRWSSWSRRSREVAEGDRAEESGRPGGGALQHAKVGVGDQHGAMEHEDDNELALLDNSKPSLWAWKEIEVCVPNANLMI